MSPFNKEWNNPRKVFASNSTRFFAPAVEDRFAMVGNRPELFLPGTAHGNLQDRNRMGLAILLLGFWKIEGKKSGQK